MTDAQIVEAVHEAARGDSALGFWAALTWINNDGIEKPTDVAKRFVATILQAASTAPAITSSATAYIFSN